MSYRIGVDIGGTFTDFAMLEEGTGRLEIHKQLTTPPDPSQAVAEGCEVLLKRTGVSPDQVSAVVHGTTLVTNAVIERKGAKTGMLVTRGFSDVLDIALERRYDIFDLRSKFPDPIVSREDRIELSERMRFDGTVAQELDLDEVRAGVRQLVEKQDVQAVAVCLLHSYVNDKHERAVVELIQREFPQVAVSGSAEVSPHIREYERWTTATVNAYAQPKVQQYLAKLQQRLKNLGIKGNLFIMASNGGIVTPEVAGQFPVRIIESGPAAGALMSTLISKRQNVPHLLSFDMGGTTAKGCVIRNGEPLKKYQMEVARVHEFKLGSGLPIHIPVIDMIEIGSGGGSLAEVDTRSAIRVGPHSAGAMPGPSCYARGGTGLSLTDADLLLGYLNADYFLGGKMKLDRDAAQKALETKVSGPLKTDPMAAAWGVHEVAVEDVARAFRVHASERGIDYRQCQMVAFGGAGPLRALRIARKLRIPRVIIPVAGGVMSALGLLASPASFEAFRSEIVPLAGMTPEQFAARIHDLSKEATVFLAKAGVAEKDTTINIRLDMRYLGQGYEVEVALPQEKDPKKLIAMLPQLYAEAYARIFSMTFLEEPIEIVNWKVEARGPTPNVALSSPSRPANASTAKATRTRRAYFPEWGEVRDCPVYSRYDLQPGTHLKGPALIEEDECTCVIGVNDAVEVDEYHNLIGITGLDEASR